MKDDTSKKITVLENRVDALESTLSWLLKAIMTSDVLPSLDRAQLLSIVSHLEQDAKRRAS